LAAALTEQDMWLCAWAVMIILLAAFALVVATWLQPAPGNAEADIASPPTPLAEGP
jgi:hypothetical protein